MRVVFNQIWVESICNHSMQHLCVYVFQDSMTANAHGINRDWTLQYVTYHVSCIKCGQMWNKPLFSVKVLSQSLCTVVAHNVVFLCLHSPELFNFLKTSLNQSFMRLHVFVSSLISSLKWRGGGRKTLHVPSQRIAKFHSSTSEPLRSADSLSGTLSKALICK